MSKAIVDRFNHIKGDRFDLLKIGTKFTSCKDLMEHLDEHDRIICTSVEELCVFMEFYLNDDKFVEYFNEEVKSEVDLINLYSTYLGIWLLSLIDNNKATMMEFVAKHFKSFGEMLCKFSKNANFPYFKNIQDVGYGEIFIQQCFGGIKTLGNDFAWNKLDLNTPFEIVDFSLIKITTETNGCLMEIILQYIFHNFIDFSDNFLKRTNGDCFKFFKQFNGRNTDVILLSHLLRRRNDTPNEINMYYPEHICKAAEVDYFNQNLWKSKILNYFKSDTFLTNSKLMLVPNNIGKIQWLMTSVKTSQYGKILIFDDSFKALIKWNENFPNGFVYTFRQLYFQHELCKTPCSLQLQYNLLCRRCKIAHREAFIQTLNKFVVGKNFQDIIKKIHIYMAPTKCFYSQVKDAASAIQHNEWSKTYWDTICEFLVSNTYCCDSLWNLKLDDLDPSASCWKRDVDFIL